LISLEQPEPPDPLVGKQRETAGDLLAGVIDSRRTV
jgi:hypothetical protein